MMPSAPAPIAPHHDCTPFASATPALDDWLKRRALANHLADATRTYVSCINARVIGYHALAAAAVEPEATGAAFRRNMPNPIPVIVLARLAVDCAWQGQGIGRALFRDAAARVLAAAEIVGARGMIVHALNDDARGFYRALGMRMSPLSPMTLMLSCADLRRGFG